MRPLMTILSIIFLSSCSDDNCIGRYKINDSSTKTLILLDTCTGDTWGFSGRRWVPIKHPMMEELDRMIEEESKIIKKDLKDLLEQ